MISRRQWLFGLASLVVPGLPLHAGLIKRRKSELASQTNGVTNTFGASDAASPEAMLGVETPIGEPMLARPARRRRRAASAAPTQEPQSPTGAGGQDEVVVEHNLTSGKDQ